MTALGSRQACQSLLMTGPLTGLQQSKQVRVVLSSHVGRLPRLLAKTHGGLSGERGLVRAAPPGRGQQLYCSRRCRDRASGRRKTNGTREPAGAPWRRRLTASYSTVRNRSMGDRHGESDRIATGRGARPAARRLCRKADALSGGAGRFRLQRAATEENRYRVSFAGNSATSLQTVDDYLLYRAAELTVQTGHDWFQVRC